MLGSRGHPAGLTHVVQVLMVVFEILSSHLHMTRWHEAKIDQHTHDLEALQEAGAKLRERLQALDQVSILWSPVFSQSGLLVVLGFSLYA